MDEDSAVPTTELEVPGRKDIWLEEGKLCCAENFHSRPRDRLRQRPEVELLDRFQGLAEADDGAILDFAREYGMLGLCGHGVPAAHTMQPRLSGDELGGNFAKCAPSRAEPVRAWKALAREAAALLGIAQNLAERRPSNPDDQRCIESVPYRVRSAEGATLATLIRDDRREFSSIVTNWLEMGLVIPELTWSNETGLPQMTLGGGMWFPTNLFGALALQLALRVCGPLSLYPCSGCGNTYMPSRRPAATRKSFCDSCRRRRVPQNRAQNRLDAAQREVWQRWHDGEDLDAIAKVVGKKVSQIRKWLAKRMRKRGFAFKQIARDLHVSERDARLLVRLRATSTARGVRKSKSAS